MLTLLVAAALSPGQLAAGLPGLVAAGLPGLVAAGLPGLVAAGLIDAIGPLLIVAFWVIRQVLVSIKEQRELDRARKEAEERGEAWPPAEEGDPADEQALEAPPAPRAEAAGPPVRPGQADLRSEVEEFLRRAANPAAAPAPAEKRSLDPFEERPTRKRPKATPRQRAQQERAQQERAQQARTQPPSTGDRQSESAPTPARVSLRHLPESQLAENAAHLGESIASADERVESRLHDKFDHRLGRLTDRPSTTSVEKVAEPVSDAARIRQMLSQPGGARDAVILGEILRSPSDRF